MPEIRIISRSIENNPNYSFVMGDICDPSVVDKVMQKADHVVHFAAESHVDRSIEDASAFVRTNILGTFTLLESARKYKIRRFIHISTDEVYGSKERGSFKETDILTPSSPYSSSKAGSDLLAQSYYLTHRLPVIITRCTNNFGPYQYPEKLMPLFITNLLENKKVPVYGQVRTYGTGYMCLTTVKPWILCCIMAFPARYTISGAGDERSNIEITKNIIKILGMDESMIEYVEDRKGHDFRYSLNCTKLRKLGWSPENGFNDALESTVRWYVENRWWWEKLKR